MNKNAVEIVQNQKSPGFFNRLFLVPKPNNRSRPEQTKSFPQGGKIQNGDTGNRQNIPPTSGVGYLNRFQGRQLPHTNTGTVQERFHIQGQTYRLKALPFGRSTAAMDFTVIAKEMKLMPYTRV